MKFGKTWPFSEKEQAALRWICSPYRRANGTWWVVAIFKSLSTNKEKNVEVPWGVLPYLRFGATYTKQGLMKEKVLGWKSQVNYLPEYPGEIVDATSVPRVLWDRPENNYCEYQKIWKFTNEKKTYYIPCVELLRAFMLPSAFLANLILQPYGMDDIIASDRIEENSLHIEFHAAVPYSVLTASSVWHMAWIKYNAHVRRTWDSVYNQLFVDAVKKKCTSVLMTMQNPEPISWIPPIETSYTFEYRGCSAKSQVFILEILGIQGLRSRFSDIEYSHPAFIKKLGESEPSDKPRKKWNWRQEESELDLTGDSTTSNEQFRELITAQTTILSSKTQVKVKRQYNISNDGKHKSSESYTKEFTRSTMVSVEEGQQAGGNRPIDFNSLEVVDFEDIAGLETFIKAISLIREQNPNWVIHIDQKYLPSGKRFSITPAAKPRSCIVVSMTIPSKGTCWMIEIARPDDWSISTLVFKLIDISNADNLLTKLLEIVVAHEGHWAWEEINELKIGLFKKLVHTQDSSKNVRWWAKRIVSKIDAVLSQ